jgi:C_GCAxxG_C_C family probable redox protein
MALTAKQMTLLDKIQADGEALHKEVGVCARSTLLAVARNLDLGSDEAVNGALKTAIPLSGGIAGTRNECGALVGGVMAIGMGLVTYDPRTKNPEGRKIVMSTSKKFFRWFEKEIGHASCYDIRDANLGRFFDQVDPVENQKYIEAGGNELCAGIVGKAARKAAEMILEVRNA